MFVAVWFGYVTRVPGCCSPHVLPLPRCGCFCGWLFAGFGFGCSLPFYPTTRLVYTFVTFVTAVCVCVAVTAPVTAFDFGCCVYTPHLLRFPFTRCRILRLYPLPVCSVYVVTLRSRIDLIPDYLPFAFFTHCLLPFTFTLPLLLFPFWIPVTVGYATDCVAFGLFPGCNFTPPVTLLIYGRLRFPHTLRSLRYRVDCRIAFQLVTVYVTRYFARFTLHHFTLIPQFPARLVVPRTVTLPRCCCRTFGYVLFDSHVLRTFDFCCVARFVALLVYVYVTFTLRLVTVCYTRLRFYARLVTFTQPCYITFTTRCYTGLRSVYVWLMPRLR